MIGIGEKLKRAAAGAALEVMFDDFTGPRGIEDVLKRTGAFGDDQPAVVYGVEEPAREFEVFSGLVKAEALHEPFALRAGHHWLSVPLSSVEGSYAEGAWVMQP